MSISQSDVDVAECPLAASSRAANDPEPVEKTGTSDEEPNSTEEPPEPGDIDRESR